MTRRRPLPPYLITDTDPRPDEPLDSVDRDELFDRIRKAKPDLDRGEFDEMWELQQDKIAARKHRLSLH